MATFHKLRITSKRLETADTVTLTFDVPIWLKSQFAYKQGQYLTIRHKVNGEELRRSYSFCSNPYTNEPMMVAVKRTQGGVFSNYVHESLQVGDLLEVMPPQGKFYTELRPEQSKHYVGIAGGSGITPFMSIIKATLTVEPESRFTLLYGSRSAAQIIFKRKLDELMVEHPDRLKVYHLLSEEDTDDPLFQGLLSVEKLGAIHARFPTLLHANEFFICGPQPMLEAALAFFSEKGIPEHRIHYELFTVSQDAEKPAPQVQANVHSEVSIILDDEEYTLELSTMGLSILDAALEEGLDAPYSCKGGVCSTCRAKVRAGKVIMDKCYALSAKEIEEGYILTCQSHPVTERLIIDYDAN